MANVLITGASGFIGHVLTTRLVERGDRVRCLVRKTSRSGALVAAGAELVYGDLSTPSDDLAPPLEEIDVVYHLAGITRALNRAGYFSVNETGSRRLYAACAQLARPPVVTHVSSLSAAGPTTIDRPLTERDPPRPVSLYGKSKLAGELVARGYARRMPISIVRPPIVLGEGDLTGLDMFKGIARVGVHLQPVLRTDHYSVVHVEDLVAVLILVAERGERLPDEDASADLGHGVYYAASAPPMSYAELGYLVGAAVGRQRMRVVRTPAFATWAIGAAGSAISQLRRRAAYLSIDKVREATAGSWACSADKSAEQLGFVPSEPLADRLRQTAEWYRRAGLL